MEIGADVCTNLGEHLFAQPQKTYRLKRVEPEKIWPMMIVRESNTKGGEQENKIGKQDIAKHVLDYLISSCRSHADVINMHYICRRKGIPPRYMNDLIGRKKPLKDNERIRLMLSGLIEYCDEVDILRSKIEKVIDEIGT